LRLLQNRDGTIKEALAVLDDQPKPKSEVSYTPYIIEASRLKPQ